MQNRFLGGASLHAMINRSPDGDGAADGETTVTPPAAPAAKPERQERQAGFSAEYVRDLREENKGWRLKAGEQETSRKHAEAEAKTAKEALDAAKAESEIKITEALHNAKTAADARVVNAELKALAIKAGMIDLDGLKLADVTGIKLGADGNVEGGEEMLAKLKEAKPYLFGAGKGGTSATTAPPKPDDGKPKPVKDMTPAEYQAVKSAAIRANR